MTKPLQLTFLRHEPDGKLWNKGGDCQIAFCCFKFLVCENIIKVYYSPTDAQVNCLKNNIKIYIKIYIKTTPMCFGAVTPSSGSVLLVLAKVTVVKIAN